MVFLRQFHARVQTLFNMNVAGQPTQLSVSERGRALPWRGEFLGFNVGINAGEAAGQTVMHCHIHLIPHDDGGMVGDKLLSKPGGSVIQTEIQ
jgi:diadenosine tetraphosphate (Ap4A) HIT family hydrolase